MDVVVGKALLDRFAAAWDARNVDEVVDCFSIDGVYFSSMGPLPGQQASGHKEIRALLVVMFNLDKGALTSIFDVQINKKSASWKWRYLLADGRVELGCDFFEFENDRISLKDAYRKVRV
jgi:hypothetical protein